MPAAWQVKHDLFQNQNYRTKLRDTQAILLSEKNIQNAASVCSGTVINIEGTLSLRFVGLREKETAFVGDYLVRTVMPGDEYYSVMSPAKFRETYEKIESSKKSTREHPWRNW